MRKHWIDNLRWVTVLLVLFYHVIYFYNNKGVFGGIGGFGLKTLFVLGLMFYINGRTGLIEIDIGFYAYMFAEIKKMKILKQHQPYI